MSNTKLLFQICLGLIILMGSCQSEKKSQNSQHNKVNVGGEKQLLKDSLVKETSVAKKDTVFKLNEDNVIDFFYDYKKTLKKLKLSLKLHLAIS
jgi:hypothetical protein